MRWISLGFIVFLTLFLLGCGSEEQITTETPVEEPATGTEVTVETPEEAEPETVEETTIEAPVEEETTQEGEETSDAVTEETTSEITYEGASQAGCEDSDGGKNYELYGTIVDAHGTTDYDRCTENTNYPGRLYESYCKESGYRGRETYDCPSGKCEAGACVAEGGE